jgi:uncharacterized protein
MKKIIFILLLCLGFSNIVKADYQAGVDALNSQNYPLAIKEFLPLALNDNPDAENSLGGVYFNLWIEQAVKDNKGVALGGEYKLSDEYYVESFFWLNESRKKGNKDAENLLKNFFNPKELLTIIKQHSERGIPLSQFILAGFHWSGSAGFLKNYKKSAQLTEKAAEKGLPQAQFLMGNLYIIGQGVDVSLEKSAYWIDLAYSNGIDEAKQTWDDNELWKYY